MKTISPAQCGAVEEALRLGLTDLAPSILEKDLLITEVLGMLAAFDWGEIQAVFCGGTSLSKGHGVIQRMSEAAARPAASSALVAKSWWKRCGLRILTYRKQAS